MFDVISFILGKKSGEKTVVFDSNDYTFSDDGSGNITVEEIDNGE